MVNPQRDWRNLLYLLFAISGFSGLLYESIWSHYLKLFLGHAAYAQTLVLAIFMGGMAIGAWIPSRYGARWKSLLLTYAAIEAVIGLCAILFHKTFVVTTDIAYDFLIPALALPWSVNLLKWSLAGLLILPQSILLGMTFPLMSAGVIRHHPAQSGTTLAMLYFTNSLGAAIGVLVGGFYLVDAVGLPGTVLTAGLINIAVALVVWYIARRSAETPSEQVVPLTNRVSTPGAWRFLVAVSFLTGMASFIYEIGWIRMLSLVLGTSTHSFELMLSAFIFGLALGGLWMRRRIDRLSQPIIYLGWIQLIMGVLALGTLVAYNTSFDTMHLLMRSLSSTDGGYFLFNLGSHAIAILIMVPVTFCAGMTLPLITHILLRSGHGEKSIGIVYAANTLGAIAGIFFAVHTGMTMLGLKGLISAGAAVDMALGVALLATATNAGRRRAVPAAVLLGTAAFVFVIGGVELDRYKMASGVYRHGHFLTPDKFEVIYHKDGKTATVDLIKDTRGGTGITIATNGKADARLNMSDDTPGFSDEHTMTLAGILPLLYHPHPKSAANIGMGSGLTTHVLLNNKTLERVDTIEIEPAMIEAARGFRPRVELAFSDSRSRFHIDDAKTFFAANKSRYDIIVSEPSNPWVSGVSSLFTDEFYRRARTHLNPGGIFLQWIHVYEMDFRLVASVMKTIGRNFSDYYLFAANDGDMLVVAVRDGKLPDIDRHRLKKEIYAQLLNRIDIYSYDDLALRRIGGRALLEPLFESTPVPVNSDYFPFLDLNAVRARFLKSDVMGLTLLRSEEIPVLELLGGEKGPISPHSTAFSTSFTHSRKVRAAAILHELYAGRRLRHEPGMEPDLFRHVSVTWQLENSCGKSEANELWLESAFQIMNATIPYMSRSDVDVLRQRLRASHCFRQLSPANRDAFELVSAVARRNAPEMASLAGKLLRNNGTPARDPGYFLAVGMLGHLVNNEPEASLKLWKMHAPKIVGSRQPGLVLRLLWAHSVSRSQAQSAEENWVSRLQKIR